MNWAEYRLRNDFQPTTMIAIEPVAAELVAAVTRRRQSAFSAEMAQYSATLHETIAAARVLVIGAAGSIGAAFAKTIAGLRPRGLVLLDINENGLADLVRDLRASPLPLPRDFATSAIAIGSRAMRRFLEASAGFDLVLDFAAMKHVRSERDPYSLMRMIETNVLALEEMLDALSPETRVFSVSSDKAVDPASLMGATKRWMERILARHAGRLIATSARFANVAFSNGSLPRAFLHRLKKRQPIAAPSDVRRYFISHEEAAQLCLLAAVLGDGGDIFVPSFFTESDATNFPAIAREVLHAYGLVPVVCASEEEARTHPLLHAERPTEWPCYFDRSDTSGEKPLEAFYARDETFGPPRFAAIKIVRQPAPDEGALRRADAAVRAVAAMQHWDARALAAAIGIAVPELDHRRAGRSLDDKM